MEHRVRWVKLNIHDLSGYISTLIKENFLSKQPPEVLYKKAVLKSFAIFTGKHLC